MKNNRYVLYSRKGIGKIPIIGYLLRFFVSIALLPSRMSRFHHGIHENTAKIKSLESQLQKTNERMIELIEKINKK